MATDSQFQGALQHLDAEIAEAEARLADLRLKRQGAEFFLAYMSDVTGGGPVRVSGSSSLGTFSSEGTLAVGTPQGITSVVERIMRDNQGNAMTIQDVGQAAEAAGHQLDRDQLRNALHYLMRKKVIKNAGRGLYRLPNAESPATTGDSGSATANGSGGDAQHEQPDSNQDHGFNNERPNIDRDRGAAVVSG